jgi:hypothetical protein
MSGWGVQRRFTGYIGVGRYASEVGIFSLNETGLIANGYPSLCADVLPNAGHMQCT